MLQGFHLVKMVPSELTHCRTFAFVETIILQWESTAQWFVEQTHAGSANEHEYEDLLHCDGYALHAILSAWIQSSQATNDCCIYIQQILYDLHVDTHTCVSSARCACWMATSSRWGVRCTIHCRNCHPKVACLVVHQHRR